MKGEMHWAVPQPRPCHTAKVSHNLPETTKSIRLANRPSRTFHTHSEASPSDSRPIRGGSKLNVFRVSIPPIMRRIAPEVRQNSFATFGLAVEARR